MIQVCCVPHGRLGNSCDGTCPLADLSGPDIYKWIQSKEITQAAPLCDLPLSPLPPTGLYICLPVLPACPSVCLSVCLPACPLCLSVCLPDSLPACLPTSLPACLSLSLSIRLSVCLSVCPACLPVFLSLLYRCLTRRCRHLPR